MYCPHELVRSVHAALASAPVCDATVPKVEPVKRHAPDPARPPVEHVIASNMTAGVTARVAGRRAAKRHAP